MKTSPGCWVLRRVFYVLLLCMADGMLNNGVTTLGLLHLSQNNTAPNASTTNILNDYLISVLNRSRALEEVIYSDIINNIRSMVKEEVNRTTRRDPDDSEEVENHWTNTKIKEPTSTSESSENVFLESSRSGAQIEEKKYLFGNVTPGNDEYLLGYSGIPFGSRKVMAELAKPRMVETSDFLDPMIGDMRKKRSVVHLYNMVLCATGCNPFSYKGYGCYCGFLGSGFVTDGIDSCCKMHDWCYNSAGCPMFLEYFIPYLWKCYHHQPLCAIDHGHYGGPGSCAQRLCECDRQLALCLRRYPCPTTKALCTSSPWRLLQNIIML